VGEVGGENADLRRGERVPTLDLPPKVGTIGPRVSQVTSEFGTLRQRASLGEGADLRGLSGQVLLASRGYPFYGRG